MPPPFSPSFLTSAQSRGVEIELRVEIGFKLYTIFEITQWRAGSMVLLDKKSNTLLNIYANDQLVGKGKVVEVSGLFAIKLVEIIKPKATAESD